MKFSGKKAGYLIEVSAQLSAANTVAQTADVVVTQIRDAFGVGGAMLMLTEAESALRVVAQVGWTGTFERWRVFPITESVPAGAAVLLREPVWTENRTQRNERFPEIAGLQPFPRTATIPLVAGERCLGVLTLSFTYEAPFSEEERNVLIGVARHCALALDRALLFERLDRRLQRERALAEIGKAFGEERDPSALCEKVARVAAESIGDLCSVRLPADGGDTMRLVAYWHKNETLRAFFREALSDYEIRVPTSPVAAAAMAGRTVLHPVLSLEDNKQLVKPAFHLHLEQVRIHSLAAIPLLAGGKAIGYMTLASTSPELHYTDEDVRFAKEIADRAASAIELTRLLDSATAGVRARDEFLSIASHELRTPITALSLRMQSYERRFAGEPMGEVFKTMTKQVARLTKLIDGLLDISRGSSQRVYLEKEWVRLTQLFTVCADEHKDMFAKTGSTFHVECDPSLPVFIDRTAFGRVLTNLVGNALKYGEGKPIKLTGRKDGDDVVIEVTDEGIGVPPEFHVKIFDRFERGVADRQHTGLGLGLFISKQIVELHGGTITVTSVPERGSTFTVRLRSSGEAVPAA